MKYIFIINPASGSGRAKSVIPEVARVLEKTDYDIYTTKKAGDAREYVREIGKSGVKSRVFICGGDGTLNEVINGAFGFENIEIGIIPLGTGNDFIRNFLPKGNFLNLENQVRGESILTDVIKIDEKYFINIGNIGLDSDVVACVSKIKNSIIRGSFAYIAGLCIELTKNRSQHIKVTFDDGEVFDDDIIVCVIANGAYYGGGFKPTPLAKIDDGLIDVLIVRRSIKLLDLIKLLPAYKEGRHFPNIENRGYVLFKKCRYLKIKSAKRSNICIDGEINKFTLKEISIIPRAIKIILPKGSYKINK